ncbi:MAG: hypothetical protein WC820_00915 [Spirochaetales bacterium]|jgi:hypothetical protein
MTAAKKSGASAARSVLMGLLGALVGALLAACSLPTTPTIGSSIDINFDLSAESVLKINFAGNDAAKVKLLNVSAGQLYMAKANVSGATAAASNTGSVASFATVREAAAARGAASQPGILMDKPGARDFVPPPGGSSRFITPSGSVISFGPADGTLTVGSSTRQFWVQTTGQTTWTQQTATLRAATNVAYIWVADSNYSNLSALNNDNLLNLSQIDALANKFGTDPTAGNGIRALVSNIFSTENGGEVGGDGGIDGDQHILIFIYDIDGDYTSTQSSGMVGYFWAKDEYLDASVAPTYRSNQAELFYLDAYFADLDADLSTSTLAHEYQHMIQFNQKKLLRSVEASTWFDEMCSMASEDFVGQTLGIPDSASPRSRIPQFKSSYYQAGVTEWLTGTNVLKSYASLYVFGAYLSRNFGGAGLFHNLVVSSQVDQAAISSALQSLGTGTTFDAAFRDYNSTFVFGNPAPTGAYSFPAKASLYNGVTYNLPAFALSDYSPGLAVFSPSGQVDLRPYGHSIHGTSSWSDPAEGTVITVLKPADADVQVSLLFVR